MKKIPLYVSLVALLASPVLADTPVATANVQRATRPLQAVFVWALGKDPGNVGDVELDIQEELIKHGVAGERSTKLFPDGMTGSPADILARMRKTVCDSVLIVRRTSTIRWQSENAQTASLRSFITHRADYLNPKDALEGSFTGPIEVPNITDNADWEIVQGEALVFDLKSGKPLWHGNTQIKSAKDLPQAKYLQFVAEKVVRELETAGLVGPVKK